LAPEEEDEEGEAEEGVGVADSLGVFFVNNNILS